MIRAGGKQYSRGFTMVEILVTIAVIAVLASVVLAGYSSIQNRAFDATVQNDIAAAMKTLTQYRANNGKFPTAAQLSSLPEKLGFVKTSYDTSGNNVLYCYSTDGQQASLIAKSKTGNTYYVTNTSRIPTLYGFAFAVSGATACPDSGLPSGSSWQWVYDITVSGWANWAN